MKKALLTIALLVPCFLFAQTLALVINEVDYDQPSIDVAEFIELKNTGSIPIEMSTISVDLINGASGGAVVYLTLEDMNWPTLMPGDYFVICGNAGFTLNCDADVQPDVDLVQNGDPDAIAVRFTADTVLLDKMSYEGDVPGFVEVSGSDLQDPSWGGVGGNNENKSISRVPDGIDTNNNNDDFEVACITPGAENFQDTLNCVLPTGILNAPVPPTELFTYVIPQSGTIMFNIEPSSPSEIELNLYDLGGRVLYSRSQHSTNKWSGGIPVSDLRGKMVVMQVITDNNVLARRIWVP